MQLFIFGNLFQEDRYVEFLPRRGFSYPKALPAWTEKYRISAGQIDMLGSFQKVVPLRLRDVLLVRQWFSCWVWPMTTYFMKTKVAMKSFRRTIRATMRLSIRRRITRSHQIHGWNLTWILLMIHSKMSSFAAGQFLRSQTRGSCHRPFSSSFWCWLH